MAKMNKALVEHIYTADPSAHVFEGKLYIYPSHDLAHEGEDNDNGDQYKMQDYHVLRMDGPDAECIDCGEALHMKNVPWVGRQMWAPDAAFKNGKYYLYFPAKDKDGIFHIGVAVGDRPEGPFVPQTEPMQGSFSIDPAVFVDDDGRGYIYIGGLWGGQLEKWQTGSYDPDGAEPAAGKPALGPRAAELTDDMLEMRSAPAELLILDENGDPIRADDEDRRYFEGPWMHKYNGKYYLSYSTGTTHYLVYAVGDSPMGPFTYRGRILEPVIGWTTHHSIVEFEGKWYLFYHDASMSGGVNHLRCVKFRELKYDDNGDIVTMRPYEE